jgi:glutathione S-transferase
MTLKLFVFHGGPAPRRTVVYLKERNFEEDFIEIISCTMAAPGAPAEAPGKPTGSVPLLHDPETGFLLRESLAIMDYLEDLAEERGLPTMRGCTPAARAKTKEMMGLIDAVTTCIEYAPVFGCKLFAPVVGGEQSAATVRWLLGHAHQNLERIAEYAPGGTPWLVTFDGEETRVTMADCALFVVLQYAENMFGWDLAEKYPRLRQFYDAFKWRTSAAVPEGTWSAQLTDLTKEWITY